jgi:hypothetical protein
MQHASTLLFLVLWALLISAFPANQEGDETPQRNYVPSPRTRGTWTILSISCSALIGSTWSVLHLSIQKRRQYSDQSWKDRAKNVMRDLASPLKWTVAAIIAPESLVGFAFSDWMHIRNTQNLLRKYGKGNIQSWDRTQIYFANMGGFVFTFKILTDESKDYSNLYNEETWKAVVEIAKDFREDGSILLSRVITKSFGLLLFNFRTAVNRIAGLYLSDNETPQNPSVCTRASGPSSGVELRSVQDLSSTNVPLSSPSEVETETVSRVDSIPSPSSAAYRDEVREPVSTVSGSRGNAAHALSTYNRSSTHEVDIYLNGTQILVAQYLGILTEPPEVSTERIQAISKSTPFAKIFFAFPVITLVYHVLAQIRKNLPVSQLEIAVFAYTICTMFAYAFTGRSHCPLICR